jgi:hypothetical protein
MPADLRAAEDFMLRNARLVERRRWEFLFANGGAEPVIDALRGYQNADGGFGHALEPDGRGSASQPLHLLSAFDVLDDLGAFEHPVGRAAIDYLGTIVGRNGGIPNVLPSIADAPRPPWWDFESSATPDGSLIPTGQLVAYLLKHRVDAAWLPRAIEFCWARIEAIERTFPYEIHQAVSFLNQASDRDRAEQQAERLGAVVRKARLVAFDLTDISDVRIPPGFQPGEVHTPLDYAPTPDSLARRWFTDDEIERDLDALAGAQDADGGWWFRWGQWNPATTIEWRGVMTILALKTLRAYGRL